GPPGGSHACSLYGSIGSACTDAKRKWPGRSGTVSSGEPPRPPGARVETSRPPWFDAAFAELTAGRDLAPAAVTAAVRDFVAGRVPDAFGAAFLTALRAKGESADEVAAGAAALREQMIRLVPVSGPVLDTCGTGGD